MLLRIKFRVAKRSSQKIYCKLKHGNLRYFHNFDFDHEDGQQERANLDCCWKLIFHNNLIFWFRDSPFSERNNTLSYFKLLSIGGVCFSVEYLSTTFSRIPRTLLLFCKRQLQCSHQLTKCVGSDGH